MPEILQKLQPDRDLQCYFYHPSAIAAISGASPTGLTLSGSWRQQFDWAVLEWNRDNVFEHPSLRYLPDGDLSGLSLSYQESRTNCIPLDSDLYPTVDWPTLRIWAGPNGAEQVYYVNLASHATPSSGSYACAFADFTLSGTPGAGAYIGIANVAGHYTYQMLGSDTLASAAQAVVDSINGFSPTLKATCSGSTVRVYYTAGASIADSTAGANGNRVGVYSYVSGTSSLAWNSSVQMLSGGTSPSQWQINLDFSNLTDRQGQRVPTNQVRKMRWTYAADQQQGAFRRTDFAVAIQNWTVTGTGRLYAVAGPGSVRVEDSDDRVSYTGTWSRLTGNYSGGSIHQSTSPSSGVGVLYTCPAPHGLYLGARATGTATAIAVSIDGGTSSTYQLRGAGDDYLLRLPFGTLSAGSHSVAVRHAGSSGDELWFDFLEAAVPTGTLPDYASSPKLTLATDWDTDHSLALAPERTAWMVNKLGFKGRANHYVGALWFYELASPGNGYASGTVSFSGTAAPNSTVTLTLGRQGQPNSSNAVLEKLVHVGDTPGLVAAAFAQEINRGYTGVWASVLGATLTIQSRSMGTDGNAITLACSSTDSGLGIALSGAQLSGGVDGSWLTDMSASPRLNPAVRDWSRAFYVALKDYGIDCAASFSMELGNGDPSTTAGIAQRGPSGDAILLPTPSLQTNFSPVSLAYWRDVYSEMASLQAQAGLTPYLQFGEVQWWYLPTDGLGHNYSGMPFYDAYTTSQYQAQFGANLPVYTTNGGDPTANAQQTSFLSGLIGEFTSAIQSFVRQSQPSCRFEVLYPCDVNETAFNQGVNFAAVWTASGLNSLKTENFGFTLGRDLDKAEAAIRSGAARGFGAAQRSHLVGIGDPTTPWWKEARSALGQGFESVVLFALDQFCLIGYSLPLKSGLRRSSRF